jgi:predicted Zn-ribbon and HTH transcriptional regulator
MPAKYTTDTFMRKAKEINSNIKVIGYYVDARTKIKTKCNKCGLIKSYKPSDLLKPMECSNCALAEPHNEFIEQLSKVNNDIEILDKFTGKRNDVLARCKKCGREWNILAYRLLDGSGCSNCKKPRTTKSKTHEEYVDEVKVVNPNFEIISKYTKGVDKIKVRCNLCKYEWETKAIYLLGSKKCPNCKK